MFQVLGIYIFLRKEKIIWSHLPTYFGGIGESRFENGSINKMARVHIVAWMAGGRLRVVRITGWNSVMMEKTSCQLGMLLLLLLLLLTVMCSRCSSHVFFQHCCSHGSFATSQRPRAIYTTNVSTSSHSTPNSRRFGGFLMFLVLYLQTLIFPSINFIPKWKFFQIQKNFR